MIDEFYSTNDEDFDHTDPREAAQSIWENDSDANFKIGDIVTVYGLDFVKARASDFLPCIAEHLGDVSCDQIGERAMDWNITGESAQQLQILMGKTLDRWCDENGEQPNLWHPHGKSRELRMRFTDENGDSERVREEES